MKLLSIKIARAVWLMHLEDSNPKGLDNYSLIPEIVNKYKFIKYPKLEDFGTNQEKKFEKGIFKKENGDAIAVDLSIVSDGIIADTRSSTYDSDAVLDDLFTWLSDNFSRVSYENILLKRLYYSELWIQTEKNLSVLNPKLIEFEKTLAEYVKQHREVKCDYKTSSIMMVQDPGNVKFPGIFRFERAANAPFEENRYYSAAPLQTDKHLELLEELETILF